MDMEDLSDFIWFICFNVIVWFEKYFWGEWMLFIHLFGVFYKHALVKYKHFIYPTHKNKQTRTRYCCFLTFFRNCWCVQESVCVQQLHQCSNFFPEKWFCLKWPNCENGLQLSPLLLVYVFAGTWYFTKYTENKKKVCRKL